MQNQDVEAYKLAMEDFAKAVEGEVLEKAQELKQFSEIGVQRFFIQSRENQEEAEALEKILSQEEMNILDG